MNQDDRFEDLKFENVAALACGPEVLTNDTPWVQGASRVSVKREPLPGGGGMADAAALASPTPPPYPAERRWR